MKILKEGYAIVKEWIGKKFSCGKCECEFELGPENEALLLRVGVWQDKKGVTYVAQCPWCRQEVRLDNKQEIQKAT